MFSCGGSPRKMMRYSQHLVSCSVGTHNAGQVG